MQLFDVYQLFDIEIVKGKGCQIWDSEGNQYLDLYGGHAVISVGHSHPAYIAAITEQLNKLGFYSNYVLNGLQLQLAEKLGAACGYDNYTLFLINTGAEAIENALKLASFHNRKKRVVSFRQSFHGRTSAAVRITDNPSIIAPVNEGMQVTYLPINNAASVETELKKGDVSSVIIEPIQGIGGIQMVSNEFLRELRALCSKYETILILDEIQSGFGRTGEFFAHQFSGIRPDIITVAKGIANGFPMGAVLISPMFKPFYGMLGTTFGGNHLACAAAIAVLDIMEKERLIENAQKVGDYLIENLKQFSGIKEIRGRGLMIGVEFTDSVREIRNKLLFEEKVFTGVAGANIIRLLPPLCLTLEEAEDFINRFRRVL
jgi:acetylornithine aminotransferase